MSGQLKSNEKAVTDAAGKAAYENLGHAAASVRKSSQESIKKAPPAQRSGVKKKGGKFVRRGRHAPSPRGSPPYTQRGQLPRAIVYDVDKSRQIAVIGPRASIVGTSAQAQEFGGEYKGAMYPERPFMFPALSRNADRFAGEWSGSIGG